MPRKIYLFATILVTLGLFLAACQPAVTPAATALPEVTTPPQPTSPPPEPTTPPEPTEPAEPKVATISFVQEPDSLSPLYTTMWFSGITRDFWLKGLWSFDTNNEPVPELAAEIPTRENGGVSEDGKTLTVKLNPDAAWSDGEPVTAADFVFTFDMIMSDQNTVQSRYPYEDYVTSVTAQDDHTLVIEFSEPFAAWQTSIFTSYVLPKNVLEPVFQADGTLDNAEWNRAPTVGVGPFVFNEWESGSHISFTKNPNWIRPPKLDEIFIRIVPDDAAQLAAIEAGDTDFGVFLNYGDVPGLEALGTVEIVTVGSGYNEGWFLNFDPETAHPAMLDVNVRMALALATDRSQITEDLLEGLTEPPATFWDTTPPYADPSLEPYPYDPEEANRLLDEAGWTDTDGDGIRDKDGEKLSLRYITNERPLRGEVQAVVQQMWNEVGIEAELVNHSSDVFWNSFGDGGPQALGEYDVAEYSSVGSFPDPEASSNWLCSEIPGPDSPDGANWQRYCNPELDALLEEQAVTVDPEARKQLYFQIEKIMQDDVVWIGIWKDPDLWSVNNRLTGVQLSGATPFWNAHEWDASG